MESNHLEALFELGEITAPLDLVKLGRVLPSRIGKKGVRVVGLLDLLTSSYLTYKFGIAPTLSDAEDVSAKVKPLYERLTSGSLFTEQTGHGKVVVSLEEGNDLGVPPCYVTLRATVRVRPNPDSLVTALITADTMNLLPTLSNVWDIVPFSFLLDWFVPVGSYLNVVDAQAKILFVDVAYAVYTISVSEYFSNQLGSSLGWSVTDEDGAGYRNFVRLVSKQPPVFGPTNLPVTSAPGIPDYGLFGSLVYKVLS
jgi:hypothetical protein